MGSIRPYEFYQQPYADGELVDELRIADDRVVLGPRPDRIFADGTPKILEAAFFKTAYLLAQNADQVLPLPTMITLLYGYDDPTVNMVKQLGSSIGRRMQVIRKAMGEKFNDPVSGAIRSQYELRPSRQGMKSHTVGYMAVSSLNS